MNGKHIKKTLCLGAVTLLLFGAALPVQAQDVTTTQGQQATDTPAYDTNEQTGDTQGNSQFVEGQTPEEQTEQIFSENLQKAGQTADASKKESKNLLLQTWQVVKALFVTYLFPIISQHPVITVLVVVGTFLFLKWR